MNYDLLKFTFIPGLKNIVLNEIAQYPALEIVTQGKQEIYIRPLQDLTPLLNLRSILNVYIIRRGSEFNPHYISKHKSILGNLIENVLKANNTIFSTFKLSCAGLQSKEVRQIQTFILTTYRLTVAEDADMEVYIGKSNGLWETGVRVTPRPLTLREYRVANIKGGLNPNVAYAMNSFCNLPNIDSYLNIFSGSATLLIEAAQINPKLKLVGFDSNGKTNALAVQNIKKAGLLKSIHLQTANIFDSPNLGKFSAITVDLPFGMQISKGEDLKKLYECFIEYTQKVLTQDGIVVMYTSEHKILEPILSKSKFIIIEIINLRVPTSINAYLHTKIFVCKMKN